MSPDSLITRWASASGRPIRLGTTTTFGFSGAMIGVARAGTGTGVDVGGIGVFVGIDVGSNGVGVGTGALAVGRVPSMNQSVIVGRPGTGRKPVSASTVARTRPGGRLNWSTG